MTDWRRIALEKQLPRPRFPAGLGAPSLVCLLALLVLAAVGGVVLVESGGRRPAAVLESQSSLVTSAARAMDINVRRAGEGLAGLATAYDADPTHDASRVVASPAGNWLGLAVVDVTTRTAVASTGAVVPTDRLGLGIETNVARPFVGPDGQARVLAQHHLVDGRVLAAVSNFSIRPLRLNPAGRQSVLLVLGDEIAASQGTTVGGLESTVGPLIRRVVDSARRDTTTSTGWGRTYGDAQDTLDGTVPVVAAAAVGVTGATVVSVTHATPGHPAPLWVAATAGGSLALVAFLAFTTIGLMFVRPVRRLLSYVKGTATGGSWPKRPRTRAREVRQLMSTLDRLTGRRRPTSRDRVRGYPIGLAVLAGGLAVVAWSVGVVVVLGSGASTVPAQVVTDTHNRVDDVAASVRDTLDQGVVQAAEVAAADPAQRDQRLATLAGSSRFRSVYTVDGGGAVSAVHGNPPLRTTVPGGERGVRLDSVTARVPTIFAFARAADGRTVIAEFDVHYLVSVLSRVSGRLRVVDENLRTILDTHGYVAFQALTGGAGVRDSAAAAFADGTRSAVVPVGAARSLVVCAPVAGGAESATLRWAVVADRRVNDFNLTDNTTRQRAWLLGVLGVSIALLMMGWHHFVLLRPLRRVIRTMARISDGEKGVALTPQRHDEIGAVALCLDICRQASEHGAERLAGAARLRGADADHTVVLARIRADDRKGARRPAWLGRARGQ